jgi:hypothetical protein
MEKTKKQPSIKTAQLKLQKMMLDGYDDYVKTFKEFNDWAVANEGKTIGEENVPHVNKLIHDVQDAFNKIYPALNFIQIYHQFSGTVLKDYNVFLDTLKKNGAKEDRETDQWKA